MSKHTSPAVTFLTPQQSKRYQLRKQTALKIQRLIRQIVQFCTHPLVYETVYALCFIISLTALLLSPNVEL